MPDTLKKSRLPAFLKAGDERIELPPKVLETPIIPFDQSPMYVWLLIASHLYIIPIHIGFVKKNIVIF